MALQTPFHGNRVTWPQQAHTTIEEPLEVGVLYWVCAGALTGETAGSPSHSEFRELSDSRRPVEDVNPEAEESTALGIVSKQQLVKTKQAEKN
jgi:hypothetical protein